MSDGDILFRSELLKKELDDGTIGVADNTSDSFLEEFTHSRKLVNREVRIQWSGRVHVNDLQVTFITTSYDRTSILHADEELYTVLCNVADLDGFWRA